MNVHVLLMVIKIVFIIVFTSLIARESFTHLNKLLRNAGCVMENYRGYEVVFGMGIAFVPILITTIALLIILYPSQITNYITYLFAVCSIGFAGLLDDLIGQKKIKGLKNHISSFFRGRLTTGFIKAFIGFSTSAIISLSFSNSFIDLIINVFNIALFTNALNLMDLRPGRCTKIFLIIGFTVLFSNLKNLVILLPLVAMLTAAIIYLPYDLNELCMLGDTGSNIFGITLGYCCTLAFGTTINTFLFIILLIINLGAERVSITEIISKNKVLNYLDSLGRSRG